ncbi:Arc family DNA-binding protein [Vannielia sp. SX4]|uniref:Arc family DNA-binding protein n=1 Tax=Vannielia sp. SX4 TaxID=3463852 RepID=UPI0040592564
MSDRKPMQLRLPAELKAWIEAEAKKNGSSQNSEVIRAVRDRMERAETQSN